MLPQFVLLSPNFTEPERWDSDGRFASLSEPFCWPGWGVSPRAASSVEVDLGVLSSVPPRSDGWAAVPRVASGVEVCSGVPASVLSGPDGWASSWASSCAEDLSVGLAIGNLLGPPQGDLRGITNPWAWSSSSSMLLVRPYKENRDGLRKLGLKLVEGNADVIFKVWY